VKITVLLAAADVPLEAKVTKRTGQKVYTLRDRLRVFGEKGERREIVALDGTRFFVDDKGDANVIAGTTEVMWVTTRDTLVRWLSRYSRDDDPFVLDEEDNTDG
jgi:hypothetical protein